MIKVVNGPHTMFAARHMVEQLIKLGHQAELSGIDCTDESMHIIYQAVHDIELPKNYILMQTEISTSHWFNTSYMKAIEKAIAVWDYCEENIPRYLVKNQKVAIVTPGISPQQTNGKDIDYLFYGWINGSVRRKQILEEIEKQKSLRVITNALNGEMWALLARTKTVINIHYYENSPLELYRLHESVSFGCAVWLHDEQRYYTEGKDNLDEIKEGLKLIGL